MKIQKDSVYQPTVSDAHNHALIADFEIKKYIIKGKVVAFVKLSYGCSVPQEFLEIVYQQAMEGVSCIDRSEPFTAEIVCGDGFWAVLSNWERSLAGRVIVKLVEKNRLPFKTFFKSKGCVTKWYFLNDTHS